MKILITGGFGYLGGRLAAMLSAATDHELTLGTRQSQDSPAWAPQAKVVTTHWPDERELERICQGIDAVVHLAAMNAGECAADPVAALEVNGVGTARLLRAAVSQRVSRFVYLSTAHVYGAALSGPVSEDTCPEPVHPYATSHRSAEDVVRLAHRNRQIDGIVLRLSNAYGVPAHVDAPCWMLLVNNLCRQAVTTGHLALSSSGQQYRDFITMTDACRAIQHVLELPSQQLADGLYNAGGGGSATVLEMAQRVAQCCKEALGYQPQITRTESEAAQVAPAVDYRIDKLLRTGFDLCGDTDVEITATLRLCAQAAGAAI